MITIKSPNHHKAAGKAQSKEASTYLRLLYLEKEIRKAADEPALHAVMLNQMKELISADFLVLFKQTTSRELKIVSASDVASIDGNAPFIAPLEVMVNGICQKEAPVKSRPVDLSSSASSGGQLPEWFKSTTLLVPLMHPEGHRQGLILMNRSVAFTSHEKVLADHIAEVMAHAWQALIPIRRQWLDKLRQRTLRWWLLGIITLCLFIPVRLSVLAPAEVIAEQPELAVAPINGVIKEIYVTPHEQVVKGQPLLRFEDTDLRNRLTLVEEELLVKEAQLLRARQQSFTDGRSAEQIAELQATVDLKKAELGYARELLERSTVNARQDGIAVFRDESEWIGRPVQQGERIFYIADPAAVELQMFIPVRDAITLQVGTPIQLFLDTKPLSPLSATLTYASYEAEVTPEGILAYRLKASISESNDIPRIGLQGTAKLYGDSASLFMYLFRRPLAFLRQWAGL